jgi:hypothetical protein
MKGMVDFYIVLLCNITPLERFGIKLFIFKKGIYLYEIKNKRYDTKKSN